MTTPANVTCSDCGSTITPPAACGPTGYAITPDGRKICYSCSNAAERADFAAADRYAAYLSGDGRHVTTWPGGELARVTYCRSHRGGFGGEYVTVDATGPDGSRWYGRGGGRGMYLRLRRRKATPAR